jgi:hypothetical protein
MLSPVRRKPVRFAQSFTEQTDLTVSRRANDQRDGSGEGKWRSAPWGQGVFDRRRKADLEQGRFESRGASPDEGNRGSIGGNDLPVRKQAEDAPVVAGRAAGEVIFPVGSSHAERRRQEQDENQQTSQS